MPQEDLARRSITSVLYNSVANVSRVVILFVRSILLARLLPVETFGIYASALALVSLTVSAAAFGMGGAFLHRTKETEDTERAAAVHFTLKLILTSLWAVTMVIVALAIGPPTRTALLLLTTALPARATIGRADPLPGHRTHSIRVDAVDPVTLRAAL